MAVRRLFPCTVAKGPAPIYTAGVTNEAVAILENVQEQVSTLPPVKPKGLARLLQLYMHICIYMYIASIILCMSVLVVGHSDLEGN